MAKTTSPSTQIPHFVNLIGPTETQTETENMEIVILELPKHPGPQHLYVNPKCIANLGFIQTLFTNSFWNSKPI